MEDLASLLSFSLIQPLPNQHWSLLWHKRAMVPVSIWYRFPAMLGDMPVHTNVPGDIIGDTNSIILTF